MIPESTIAAVAAKHDIVDYIGQHVALKRAGTIYKGLCPFHSEKTPSFVVNPARQTYHCFGCGGGSDIFGFVRAYEGLTFQEAVSKLAEGTGIVVEQSEEAIADNAHKRTLYDINAKAMEWFHGCLYPPQIAYLKERGLSQATIKEWKIGYHPPGSLLKAKDIQGLCDAGLLGQEDGRVWERFAGRIMFPICDDQGRVVGFSGRIMEGDGAKYVNTPETPVFHKGGILFGMHRAKRSILAANMAILAEGQLDIIALHSMGLQGAVAAQGTAFTKHHAISIKRLCEKAILCMDPDPAGVKATGKMIGLLAEAGVQVDVAALVTDPADSIKADGGTDIAERIGTAVPWHQWMLTQPNPAQRVSEILSYISDEMEREKIIDATVVATRLPHERIRSMCKRQTPTPQETTEIPMAIAMQQLCRLAVTDPKEREYLLAKRWQQVLPALPDGDLLLGILSAGSGEVSVVMSALSDEQQGMLSQILDASSPETAEECWEWLKVRHERHVKERNLAKMRGQL